MSKKEAEIQRQSAPRYSKEQLISAKRFTTSDKDILAGLLVAEKSYTIEEAESVINTFKGREV